MSERSAAEQSAEQRARWLSPMSSIFIEDKAVWWIKLSDIAATLARVQASIRKICGRLSPTNAHVFCLSSLFGIPVNVDAAALDGKRPVLDRVGGEFVKYDRQNLCLLYWHDNLRPVLG